MDGILRVLKKISELPMIYEGCPAFLFINVEKFETENLNGNENLSQLSDWGFQDEAPL